MNKAEQKIQDLLTEAASLLEDIVSERQTQWDNRSERWRESDKGIDHEDRTSKIEEAKYEVEAAAATVEEAS